MVTSLMRGEEEVSSDRNPRRLPGVRRGAGPGDESGVGQKPAMGIVIVGHGRTDPAEGSDRSGKTDDAYGEGRRA
jgi:hypothetical protein